MRQTDGGSRKRKRRDWRKETKAVRHKPSSLLIAALVKTINSFAMNHIKKIDTDGQRIEITVVKTITLGFLVIVC